MSHERQDGSYPRFLRAVARALPRRAHRRDGRAGDIRSSPPRRRFPPRLQNSSRRWSRAARVPARQCEPQFARDAAIFAGDPPAPTPSSSTRAESREPRLQRKIGPGDVGGGKRSALPDHGRGAGMLALFPAVPTRSADQPDQQLQLRLQVDSARNEPGCARSAGRRKTRLSHGVSS